MQNLGLPRQLDLISKSLYDLEIKSVGPTGGFCPVGWDKIRVNKGEQSYAPYVRLKGGFFVKKAALVFPEESNSNIDCNI